MERIASLSRQLTASGVRVNNSLSVRDNRTGLTYELPIENNFIRNEDLMNIKDLYDKPLRHYDPGYTNTINCVRKKRLICFVLVLT